MYVLCHRKESLKYSTQYIIMSQNWKYRALVT
jgi:hypothetical protein